jgi:hypothetical protein
MKYLNDKGERVLTVVRFDAAVDSHIIQARPRFFGGKKSEATPKQWASHKTYFRRYCSKNRLQITARRRAYAEKNAAAIKRKKNEKYLKNCEQIRESRKRYRKENREKIAAQRKAKYREHRAAELARSRRYRDANRERVSQNRREKWAAMPPERKRQALSANAAYRKANKEKLRDRAREYYATHRQGILARVKEHSRKNPHVRKEWISKQQTENRKPCRNRRGSRE